MPLPQDDRGLLEAYFATTWRIERPSGSVSVSLHASVEAMPLPCAVITAYNPRSRRLSRRENEARDRALLYRLAELGRPVHRSLAEGTGENAELWTEPGYAVVGAAASTIVDLANAFGQNAVLWIGVDARPSILVVRNGFCDRPPGTHLRPAATSSA